MILNNVVLIFLLLVVNSTFSQWRYEYDSNNNEKIFVFDSKENSAFVIEKSKQGEVKFFIELDLEQECKINQIKFKFDGIKNTVMFSTKQIKNRLEILYNQVDGLENLETFSLFIKKRNFIYATFLDTCEFNKTKNYSLKGSSNAIDKINLIQYLNRTIKVLKAKNEKLDFIINNLPRLYDNKSLEKKLSEINLLDVQEVSWKNYQNDKYNIKIRVKLNGAGYKELFGKLRLYKPTKNIKSRY
jgi:hypothetical protein